jgi:hypothetical protein
MESNFLGVAVAPGKYMKPAAEAFAVAVVGARYVVVAVAAAVVVESHLKAKNGCPLDITG